MPPGDSHINMNNLPDIATQQCLIQESRRQLHNLNRKPTPVCAGIMPPSCHSNNSTFQQYCSGIDVRVHIFCSAVRNNDHYSPVVIAVCRKLGKKCTQHGGNRFRTCAQCIPVVHETADSPITFTLSEIKQFVCETKTVSRRYQ